MRVRNPREAERARPTREAMVQQVTEALAAIREREHGHAKAACALAAHAVYGRYVTLDAKTGRVRLNRDRIRREERLDGTSLLTTSDDTLTADAVALDCRQRLEVEEAGRTLKTPPATPADLPSARGPHPGARRALPAGAPTGADCRRSDRGERA